jgi:hypothetical protein
VFYSGLRSIPRFTLKNSSALFEILVLPIDLRSSNLLIRMFKEILDDTRRRAKRIACM